ncbi:MAG: ABC transporter ATP-binding protein [Calditrichaceae bacterium]|nr:ABC transporter ATP-binding protein [Calditrichaceae bacterium]HES58849.1 ABC transporter ATP-binding protein [Caldithrix sp.]
MIPIVINNLKKSYGAVQAVKGVSFEVEVGEVFGLIGPDGAGKTTIIRTLVSLLDPDEGEIIFMGKNVIGNTKFVRSNIGYMPQRFSLYRDLTVEENLRFFGDLFKVSTDVQDKLMKKLYAFSKLAPFKNRRAEALSGGMKQKLALSCMLMHQPKVIVLDEPTFGVDPVSRSEFWDILKSLAHEGTSVLVSTAYMDEAELCDKIALMFQGNFLALDKPDKLLQSYEFPLYLIETDQVHTAYNKLYKLEEFSDCNLFGNGLHVSDKNNYGEAGIKGILDKKQVEYKSVHRIEADLEDIFLKLIKDGSETSGREQR